MQMPQPRDEASGQMADSLLESPGIAQELGSSLESAAEQGTETEARSSIAPHEATEEIPAQTEDGENAASGEPGCEAGETSGIESVSVVEIDWEQEVEAFVKAEAAAAEGATEKSEGAADETIAETIDEPGAEASPEPVAGMEAAGESFAGAIGGSEVEFSAESDAAPAADEASEESTQASGGASDDFEAADPSKAEDSAAQENEPNAPAEAHGESADEAVTDQPQDKPFEDRRKRRRAMISAPVRVRGVNVTNAGPDEISTTIDVSRSGILFVATAAGYYKGMDVAVIFPYSDAPTAIHSERRGRVVRIAELPDGRTGVALALGVGAGEDLVDASGRTLASGASAQVPAETPEQVSDRPLVLAMDPDVAMRISLKTYLELEGYQVIAIGTMADARQVLEMCVPALVIAEIEGEGIPDEGLPGYDLCAHIKETQRLKRVPVVLTTKSAYPSDYSNAHSLGAIVCMAKPYKQERLGHVVRLLAPLQAHKEAPAVKSCTADPKRKACATPHHGAGHAPILKKKYDENTSTRRKYRFPSFR